MYCDEIACLLEQLIQKYFTIINQECLAVFGNLEQKQAEVFTQYIKKLNVEFQTALVR